MFAPSYSDDENNLCTFSWLLMQKLEGKENINLYLKSLFVLFHLYFESLFDLSHPFTLTGPILSPSALACCTSFASCLGGYVGFWNDWGSACWICEGQRGSWWTDCLKLPYFNSKGLRFAFMMIVRVLHKIQLTVCVIVNKREKL